MDLKPISPFYYLNLAMIVLIPAVFLLTHGWCRWAIISGLVLLWIILTGVGVFRLSWGFFTPVITNGSRENPWIALTFDDGPDPELTPLLLDVLTELDVQTTFFCVGRNVKENQDLVRRMDREGHLVGNHTYRHRWYHNFLFGEALFKELQWTQQVVFNAIGKYPSWYRPPVGLTNPHLAGVLKRTGLVVVGWDNRSFDRGADLGVVVSRVMAKARPGGIILMHDTRQKHDHLVGLVREVVTGLRGKGYRFVSLDRLIGCDAYRKIQGESTAS